MRVIAYTAPTHKTLQGFTSQLGIKSDFVAHPAHLRITVQSRCHACMDTCADPPPLVQHSL